MPKEQKQQIAQQQVVTNDSKKPSDNAKGARKKYVFLNLLL